ITYSQLMVIDLVMVTAPKPPGSRHSISPAGAVLEIAPAKVLQGAVRLHGLASSPTPETQVRVAWADAGAAKSSTVVANAASAASVRVSVMERPPIQPSPPFHGDGLGASLFACQACICGCGASRFPGRLSPFVHCDCNKMT